MQKPEKLIPAINDDASIGAAEVQPEPAAAASRSLGFYGASRALGEPVGNLIIEPGGYRDDRITELEKRVAAIEAWIKEQTK